MLESVHDSHHERYPQARFSPVEHELRIIIFLEKLFEIIETVRHFCVWSGFFAAMAVDAIEIAAPS
jgi:hypothetical protein